MDTRRTQRRVNLRLLAVLLLLTLTVGCTRVGFLYNNADWFIYRWIDGLLDARGSQREQWSALIEQTMDKHRRTLLADLVIWLDEAAVQARNGSSEPALRCLWQSARALAQAHAEFLIPPAVTILTSTSAAQQAHLRAELKDRSAEYRQDYLSADLDQRHSEREARFTERIAYWTGDLSVLQKRLIARTVRTMPDIAPQWLAYRESQQAQLLELLEAGTDASALHDFLSHWWMTQRDRDPQLIDDTDRLIDALIDLLIALDSTLNSTQRRHLEMQFTSLRDTLGSIAGPSAELAQRQSHRGRCPPQTL